MTDLSRRSFLAGSAGVAAGATVLAGAVAPAMAGAAPTSAADGVVVYVRDAAAGDVVVMADEASTTVTDPALVAAVARALQATRS